MSTLLEAALAHARKGRAICPANPVTKAPIIAGGRGHLDATADEDQVRTWWTDYPDAMIGYAPPRGVIIIDCDTYKPGCEFESLEAAHGVLPFTLTVRTPQGGRQLHYRVNGAPKLRTGVDVLGKFVDVKGDGDGYGILPPSERPGIGAYTWEQTGVDHMEEAPDWIVRRLLKAPEVGGAKSSNRFTKSNPCPVCAGGADDAHGQGVRCYGFLSTDGLYAHCTREEKAPRLEIESNGTFAHRLGAAGCRCGKKHGGAPPSPSLVSANLADKVARLFGQVPVAPADPAGGIFRTPVEAILAQPDSSSRLSSGSPALDAITRGGVRAGEIYAVTGRPGSSKTVLMEYTSKGLAEKHGSSVVHIPADEGDGSASVRIGQMFGFDRDKLENKDPGTLAALDARLVGINYFMAEPDETTLEQSIAKLKALPRAAGPKILFIDTINTIKAEAGADAASARERIEAIMEVIKAATRDLPCLAFVGSEANRASWSSPDPSRRQDPLAAGAESRSIEHAASVQIDMRPTDDETIFEAFVSKNRVGGIVRKLIRFKLDKATASLTELDEGVAKDQWTERKQAGDAERIAKRVKKVKALLTENPDGLHVTAIHERVAGRKQDTVAALEELKNKGESTWAEEKQGGTTRHVWKLVTP